MSLKSKLFEMYYEKSYTTDIERVSCEMYHAISNIVEILIEESKEHIDKKEAIEQIREEIKVINRI